MPTPAVSLLVLPFPAERRRTCQTARSPAGGRNWSLHLKQAAHISALFSCQIDGAMDARMAGTISAIPASPPDT